MNTKVSLSASDIRNHVVHQQQTMKFSLLASVVFVAAGLASLLPLSAIDQPAALYPIGGFNGTNAKVSGRLFEIDGKVGYFAGLFNSRLQMQQLNVSRKQCLVAGTFEQQLGC